jgi:UDP-glucose 4-epimerase
MKQWILVTGGCGYIGSHIVFLLRQNNYHIVVIDLKNPHTIQKNVIYYKADYGDAFILKDIFSTYPIAAVIHCASFIEVGHSVKEPALYYTNNVLKTIILLNAMRAAHILTLIFSSSCAVYGNPQKLPLTEEHPHNPISPYGTTKHMIESILIDYAQAYGLRSAILRYFNVAGALFKEGLGEIHEPESHIIPLVLQAAIKNKPFTIFGTDYSTPDGTCIRDYIHVMDIAEAHLKALNYCQQYNTSCILNIGSQEGYSVKEIILVVETITKKKVPLVFAERRSGDPAILIADSTKAYKILNWKPSQSDLKSLIFSAFQFYSSF